MNTDTSVGLEVINN